MGYTTDFLGKFDLDKELTPDHAEYLRKFSDTRRMKRDPEKASKLPDPIREKVGLPIGLEGGYYVGDDDCDGFGPGSENTSIIEYNFEPSDQPGLWCHWEPTKDNKGIEWNQCEKFYDYDKWLQYLIDHFLKPWGYTLSGEVDFQGEDDSDKGKVIVKDNVVELEHVS